MIHRRAGSNARHKKAKRRERKEKKYGFKRYQSDKIRKMGKREKID